MDQAHRGDRGRARRTAGVLQERRARSSRRPASKSARTTTSRRMRETGYCAGVENYSRHLQAARTRLDAVVPARLLPGRLAARRRRVAHDAAAGAGTVLRRPRAQGDAGRLRLPAAQRPGQPAADLRGVRPAHQPGHLRQRDARPTTKSSASTQVVEQIIRPTGLLDPEIEVRPTQNQVDDLMDEISA